MMNWTHGHRMRSNPNGVAMQTFSSNGVVKIYDDSVCGLVYSDEGLTKIAKNLAPRGIVRSVEQNDDGGIEVRVNWRDEEIRSRSARRWRDRHTR